MWALGPTTLKIYLIKQKCKQWSAWGLAGSHSCTPTHPRKLLPRHGLTHPLQSNSTDGVTPNLIQTQSVDFTTTLHLTYMLSVCLFDKLAFSVCLFMIQNFGHKYSYSAITWFSWHFVWRFCRYLHLSIHVSSQKEVEITRI